MFETQEMARRNFLKAVGAGSILSAAAILSACGSTTSTSAASSGSSTQGSSESSTQSESSSASGSGSASGKVLVAYCSATGHTKAVAETVASAFGADLFEIVPETPYTDDDLNFNDSGSRVSQEHRDESMRDVPLAQSAPDSFADYGTVILGYPIWWAIAAWPTNHFVSDNDFTGKTVIPFCTSMSSGIGSRGNSPDTWRPSNRDRRSHHTMD